MTIDEAIKELTESYNFWMGFACDDVLEEGEHKVNHCEKNANYCYQLIQWLEELKELKRTSYEDGGYFYTRGYEQGCKINELTHYDFYNNKLPKICKKANINGYNKGINDLENKILSNCASMLKDGDRVIVIRMDIFKFILGQLKDGVENEIN